MQKPTLTAAVLLADLDADSVRWVQAQLTVGGYLPPGQADGIPGPKTHEALAKFKTALALSYPAAVGPSTIEALANLAPPHVVSEQPAGLTQTPLVNAGRQEGSSAMLPGVGMVYQHEYIVPGVPLTWGEMTKGLDPKRIPSSVEIVNNLKALATVFGRVRTQFGTPIGVTSGYRPAALRIGVPDSQHIPGRAMDIYPINGDFAKLLQVLKAEPAVKGIGLGQHLGFLHMDIRPGDRVIFPY